MPKISKAEFAKMGKEIMKEAKKLQINSGVRDVKEVFKYKKNWKDCVKEAAKKQKKNKRSFFR